MRQTVITNDDKESKTITDSFHLRANHHGTNKEYYDKMIEKMITGDFFANDVFHFHVSKCVEGSCDDLERSLLSFNLSEEKQGFYMTDPNDVELLQIEKFLTQVSTLNLTEKQDAKKFFETYNLLIGTKLIDCKQVNHTFLNTTSASDRSLLPLKRYQSIIKEFQKYCPYRFSIAEGLHRCCSLIKVIFDNDKLIKFLETENDVAISFYDPESSLPFNKTLKSLQDLSNHYMREKKQICSRSSKDNLREVYQLLQKKNYITNTSYLHHIISNQDNNNPSLNSECYNFRFELFQILRDYIKLQAKNTNLIISDDWRTIFNLAPFNNVIETLSKPLDDKGKTLQTSPTFIHWRSETKFKNSYACDLLQLHEKKSSRWPTYTVSGEKHTSDLTIPENALVELFTRVILNQRCNEVVKDLLYNNEKFKMKQIPETLFSSERSPLDLHFLCKCNKYVI